MFGPTPFRDSLIVAAFEIREMLRTRRALILIALYMLGGLMMAMGFVEVLSRLEEAAATALGTTASKTPGALTNQLIKEPEYRRALHQFFRNREIAEFLLGLPPISLFYAWSSATFVPFLIMLTTSDSIAQERQNRGIRFVAFRTGRVEFAVGKVLGQGALLAIVTFFTGWVYVAVAWYGLMGFEFTPTVTAIFMFWPRVLVYGFSFLGLAAFCSMNSSSTNMARAFSLIALLGLWFFNKGTQQWLNTGWGPLLNVVNFLIPYQHTGGLWEFRTVELLNTGLVLLGLCALYISAGLLIFRRGDL